LSSFGTTARSAATLCSGPQPSRSWPAGQESRRRAAQWYLDRGQTSTGLELAMAAEDWAWVARALVESYAVPGIPAGSATGVVEYALAVTPVRAAEPLIQAAMLLRHGRPDAAERVLDGMSGPGATVPEAVADQISAIFVRLAVARARGETATGIDLATEARRLVAHLRIEQQHELSALLDAHMGALDLCRGEVHRAAVALRHGVAGAPGENETSSAKFDCLGQLALLEAFQGNLRVALRHAAAVLRSAATTSGPGVAHAHLATAWVHLERTEPAPARQHLDRAVDAGWEEVEPWFVTVLLLAEARWFVVTDQPEAALRVLAPARRAAEQAGQSGWRAGLLTVASADALRRSGEPRGALDLVAPGPVTTPVENGVLAASSLLDLGDVAGARAALTPLAADLAGMPLGCQVECWLLEARLAEEAGRPERAHVLVDRALRAAQPETLRRPLAHRSSWLVALVDRDAALRRAHGGFLAGLRSPTYGQPSRTPSPGRSGPVLIETLTAREAQVLGLLAEMCSTDEIASELFLSVNTVKTYVRGILRKLSVNRRVDAVRRGRELGLC
jgi:LuxR family maltose regulon positive regulatory protein